MWSERLFEVNTVSQKKKGQSMFLKARNMALSVVWLPILLYEIIGI